MSPSSLIFFLGIGKKINNLKHHVLFFDEDFSKHAAEIYEDPKWPTKPDLPTCPGLWDMSRFRVMEKLMRIWLINGSGGASFNL